ncbi:hypoxanthine phosphoribosyltransferase [Pelolinea submarina]|uniref:Hypoxanthine phosphoribosyltransferase n=2 Tax=Pelolinea submarina TaxID=913107 RepID=A0A3E0AFM4_9CHLR|nr:hypoxanthine phosphoribosyltransferase [Pelolinea submarina]
MKPAAGRTMKFHGIDNMEDYHSFLKEILVPEDKLQARIAELGKQISHDYKDAQQLLLICILRGAVMFMTDLSRHIDVPHSMDFMAISSYGAGNRNTSGMVRITMDLNTNICGRDVLIVEDIIDSGNTLAYVLRLLSTRKPKSLNICTLLDKAERREVEVPIRYTGFTIPNKFVFGYGLDLDEYYRNLPFIGVVDLERYEG